MFKEKVNKYQEETKEFISKWEEKSRDFIHNFLDHFGNSTNIIKEQVQKAISPRPTRKSSVNNGASSSSSNSSVRKPLSFSLLSNLNRRKRRNSGSNSQATTNSLNVNGKRPINEDSATTTKRTRSSYNTSDSIISKDEVSSDEDERNTIVASRTPSAKKTKKNFDDLEDVDDDLDNQIPLI